MTKREITISFDDDVLGTCGDGRLATLWHVAQANPVDFGDKTAGETVERIGREIIRRWLGSVPPELWRHQGHHHHWDYLRQFAKFDGDRWVALADTESKGS